MNNQQAAYKYSYVMLVDDNELDNFVHHKLMQAHRFAEKVYVNSGARSALEFLCNLQRTGNGSGIYPEIIFIDINMPLMDGFQFIESYKRLLQDIGCRFVILTSSLHPDDRQKIGEENGIIFLNKPLTGEMLENL